MYKILTDIYKIKDPFSGLGQFSLNFARNIIKQKDDDMWIDLLVPDLLSSSVFNQEANIGFNEANLMKRYLPILNKRYAIWHSLNQFPSHLPGLNDAWILTIHDLNFLVEKSGNKRDFYLLKLQHNVNKADYITTISNYTKSLIEANLDLKGKKVRVIYNGIAPNEVIAQKKPDFIVDESKFFFSIGIFNRKKNFHTLIPVMRHFSDHKLIIAGNKDSHYGEEIQNEISRLGMENQIMLPGKISEEEKYWLYNNCDAFLFPSLAEGFGMPVIEAMKAGKPVFISDFSSLPEVGGEAAFYFRNFDSSDMAYKIKSGLSTFHSNPDYFKNLFENNTRRFTWENSIRQYLDLYREILQTKK